MGLLTHIDSVAEERYHAEANFLNTLGILLGTDKGYELEKELTRAEAAVMIVRLQGGEVLALEKKFAHPFIDVPSWATAYVGYLYEHNQTLGISKTLFGSEQPITVSQYVTFLLRTLGYSDKVGDFYWKNSLSKAKEIQMLTKINSLKYGSKLIRGDMVRLSYCALETRVKSTYQTLLETLRRKGFITISPDQKKYLEKYKAEILKGYPTTRQVLVDSIVQMALKGVEKKVFEIDQVVNPNLDQVAATVKEVLRETEAYSNRLKRCDLTKKGSRLTVKMTYYVSKQAEELAKEKGRKIVEQIISKDMTDIEKEQVIHDYLIAHIQYDHHKQIEDSAYTMYGALIKGVAVCNGYAESFDYLGKLAGLDISIVTGEADSHGKKIAHAWNMIRLEGETYHVDVTWNDPIGHHGKNVYGYFNVTDKVMEKKHNWQRQAYPSCVATTYNYYTYNHLEVIGLEGLESYLEKAFKEGKAYIVAKVLEVNLTRKNVREVLKKCKIPYEGKYVVDEELNLVTIEKVN